MRHKFNAKRTEYNGRKYPSKLEAKYAAYLDTLVASGDIIFFLQQVPFLLPGGIIYRLDFMEFHKNGDIIFTDVKGVETKEFILKKKLMEDTYPFTLNIVKKIPSPEMNQP